MKRLRDTTCMPENRTVKQLCRFLGIGLFQYSVWVNFVSRAVAALAKPVVEAVLFLLSFVLQKQWVFRHPDSA